MPSAVPGKNGKVTSKAPSGPTPKRTDNIVIKATYKYQSGEDPVDVGSFSYVLDNKTPCCYVISVTYMPHF